MALAVAIVACQAATPKPGAKGDPGDPGAPGPAGPAGTTDNDQPMVTKPLPMVYLAMSGTGVKKTSDALDLSKHFADTEKASLNYEFMSSDKDVATAELMGGKMVVKGKKPGPATITVMVYDGVTDPVSATFDVMVVANNARPTVDLQIGNTTPNEGFVVSTDAAYPSKLGKALYATSGVGSTTEIMAEIRAGEATGINDAITSDSFSFVMGKDGMDDDIVKVEITQKAGVANTWKIALTPMMEGQQNVYVIVKDKFGVTAETPEDAVDADDVEDGDTAVPQRFQFAALVNTIPKLEKALPDKTLIALATPAETKYIDISQYFDTSEALPTEGPKVDSMEKPALVPGAAAAGGRAAGAPLVTANVSITTTCTITSSDISVVAFGTTGITAIPGTTTTATINSDSDAVNVIPTKAGTADITITCQDEEDYATDTATITVRAAR